MHYRDKVTIAGETLRANVYSISAASAYVNHGILDEHVIIVSLPAKRKSVAQIATRLDWMGGTYFVEGQARPIMALGRLDHWEITAKRTTGG